MFSSLKRLLVPVLALSLAGAALASAQVLDGDTPDATEARDDGTFNGLDAGDTELELEEGETEEVSDDELGDPTGASLTTPTARSTEGCPAGFTGNHGQFVSSTDERPRRDAAHSPCGKPVQSVHDDAETEDVDDEQLADEEEERHGKGHKNGHEKNGREDK